MTIQLGNIYMKKLRFVSEKKMGIEYFIIWIRFV